MAELEAELEWPATYFLMTESVFYNLARPRAPPRSSGCASSATASASTPSIRTRELDERFDPVLAWHNPDPDYMSRAGRGAANAMEPRFFSPDDYRSDSNQHWRHGCPHEQLERGELQWLQLLTHPEIWVYPGATMRETMLAMLDAERDRRLDQLAADRIDLS